MLDSETQHRWTCGAALAGLMLLTPIGPAQGQSLLRRQPVFIAEDYETLSAPLSAYSTFLVVPPKPKEWAQHDVLKIIINESSVQQYEHSLETSKEYDTDLEISQLPSLRHLLELQLRSGDTTPLLEVAANAEREFGGEGAIERSDRYTTRIAGTVSEVKPNGVLLVEAKKVMQSDGETIILVVSGLCDPADITREGAIQSSHLANLTIRVQHEGELRQAAKKGVIARVLDAVFSF